MDAVVDRASAMLSSPCCAHVVDAFLQLDTAECFAAPLRVEAALPHVTATQRLPARWRPVSGNVVPTSRRPFSGAEWPAHDVIVDAAGVSHGTRATRRHATVAHLSIGSSSGNKRV